MSFVHAVFLFLGVVSCRMFAEVAVLPPASNTMSISPIEDLLKDHGILTRILIVYQEIARRLNAREPFPIQALQDSAKIIRNYLEMYHEPVEEEYVYPSFLKAKRFVPLVKTLIKQHQDGKPLTTYVLTHATKEEVNDPVQAMVLAGHLEIFARMFRPHEARESSELFPSFRDVVSPQEYAHLTEVFEKKKQEMFGERGYEAILEKIEYIEKQLGLTALPQFSP